MQAQSGQGGPTFTGDGKIGGAGGDHQWPGRAAGGGPPHHRRQFPPGPISSGGLTGDGPPTARVVYHGHLDLGGVGPGENDRVTGPESRFGRRVSVLPPVVPAVTQVRSPEPLGEKLPHNGGALAGRLALAVDRLGQSLTEAAMVIDLGKTEVGEGQPTEPVNSLIRAAGSRSHLFHEALQSEFVHDLHYPARV